MQYDKIEVLEFAREVAQEAGQVLIAKRQTGFSVSKKGRINLVTEADLAAERLILGRIRERFPDHRVLAEEGGSSGGLGDVKWVVDPLDGTTNFAHGYPFYCVSIGIEVAGSVEVGVVFDPIRGETFTAARGEGAWLNGSPIRVSTEVSLAESLLVTGFSYGEDEILANLDLFNEMMRTARSVRRDGSAALDLCYVACGRYEAFWELSLHPWDIAAGSLIVEEAGGMVSLFDQSPTTIYDRECLASNGRIHGQVSEVLMRRFVRRLSQPC